MFDVYLMICPILFFDCIIIYWRYIFIRPIPFDKEIQPELIINSNYWGYLLLPFLFFVIPYAWLIVLTQDNTNLKLIPFIVCSVLTIISIYLLFRHGYKRYYLTNSGITVLNLATSIHVTYPIDTIKGYSYRIGFRGPNSYNVLLPNNKRIGFDESVIKDINSFKAYFKKHGIQYYEYDSLTGFNYKK